MRHHHIGTSDPLSRTLSHLTNAVQGSGAGLSGGTSGGLSFGSSLASSSNPGSLSFGTPSRPAGTTTSFTKEWTNFQ